MVVLGLATLILVVFVTIGIVTSQSPAPVRTTSVPVVVSGSSLKAESAAGLLGPIVTGGEPPTNILNAVFVPAGSVRVSHQNTSAGSGQFDAQVSFRADATQAEVLSFFAAVMKQQGWQVFDRGPAANATNTLEVLGKLAGTDGYYWEMGATIPADDVRQGRATHRCDALHRSPVPGGRRVVVAVRLRRCFSTGSSMSRCQWAAPDSADLLSRSPSASTASAGGAGRPEGSANR